jgi:hypothetical protein
MHGLKNTIGRLTRITPDSGFKSTKEEEEFAEEGFNLAKQLKEELGSESSITVELS